MVLLSNSMSLIASTVDSAMDFLSTVIIFGTNRVIEQSVVPPSPRRRCADPLASLLASRGNQITITQSESEEWSRQESSSFQFSVRIEQYQYTKVVADSPRNASVIASFLQVFIESVHRLLDPNLEMAFIPTSGIIVMVLTIIIKVTFPFLDARGGADEISRNSSQFGSGVERSRTLLSKRSRRMLRTMSVADLVFTSNAKTDEKFQIVFNFFSLVFPYVGQKLGWKYLDPLGGALLSVYSTSRASSIPFPPFIL